MVPTPPPRLPQSDLVSHGDERWALKDFLDRSGLVVVVIIGPPGSGKTTLLRQTAGQVSLRRSGKGRNIPILLHLREHSAKIIVSPEVGLADLLRSTLRGLVISEPEGWFEERLRAGECVVLLDGLDEVGQPEERAKISAWTERQIRRYPRNAYVVTSRPLGYISAPLTNAITLQIAPFTTEQIERFVRGWYLAAERHATGVDDQFVRTRAIISADDLLSRIRETPALQNLAVNPLFLTMIALVHRYRGALPGSLADLCAEICQVLLWQRQEAKNLPPGLTSQRKEAIVRELAFIMMREKVVTLERAKIMAVIQRMQLHLPTDVTPDNVLKEVEFSGLLIESERGYYRFTNLILQEYLASAYIRDKGLVKILAKSVDDPWWRQTILMYITRANADPIVAACLELGTSYTISLAIECANQGSEISEELLARLEMFLSSDDGIDPPMPTSGH